MGGFHPGAARTGRTLGFKSQLLHLVATSPEQNEPRFPPLYRGAYDSNMSNHLGCQSLGDPPGPKQLCVSLQFSSGNQ